MATVTVKHLSSSPATITRTERFPLPKAAPVPPSLNNITDINNLSHNFTSLLSRTPVKHVTPLMNVLPTPGPRNAKLADDATPFREDGANVKLEPFKTVDTKIKLSWNNDDEVLRLFWTAEKPSPTHFYTDIVLRSDKAEREVTVLTDKAAIQYGALWNHGASTLTLFAHTPLHKWMGALVDSLPLSALSIPGTHNSPTHYVAAPSVRCQAVGITEQLENGIRFFDIRAQPDNNNLWLVHGAFPVSLKGKEYLGKLLQTTYDFLAKNPSETVILSLKREGPFESTDQQFSKTLHDHFVNLAKDKWYTNPTVPRLKDVRGKCVLMRRFMLHDDLKKLHDNRGWGVDAESWEYNTANWTTASGNIVVQDFCEVLAAQNVDTKIKYIREHVARASALTYSAAGKDARTPFYVNFLSASNFWNVQCWPDKIAEKVNPAMRDYLCREHDVAKGDGGTGIVVADWVGKDGDWDLVRLVVAMNGVVERRARLRIEEEKKKKEEEEKKKKEAEAKKKAEEEKKKKEAEEKKKADEAKKKAEEEKKKAEAADEAKKKADDK